MYFHQYLMLVVQVSMPVEEVSSDPELPAPRIGAYLNDTKLFFFICREQHTLSGVCSFPCSVPTVQLVLCLLLGIS